VGVGQRRSGNPGGLSGATGEDRIAGNVHGNDRLGLEAEAIQVDSDVVAPVHEQGVLRLHLERSGVLGDRKVRPGREPVPRVRAGTADRLDPVGELDGDLVAPDLLDAGLEQGDERLARPAQGDLGVRGERVQRLEAT